MKSLFTLGERFFSRLLGFDISETDVLKWTVFARNLILIFTISAAGMWAFFTYNSIITLSAAFNGALSARGNSIAHAVARAAFVPLILKDEKALKRVLALYADEPDLVRLEVAGKAGSSLASRSWPVPAGGEQLTAEAPVIPSPEYADPAFYVAGPVGTIRVAMSTWRTKRELRAIILKTAFGSALFILGIIWVCLLLVRNMTQRLRELVGEARLAEDLKRSNQELEQFAFVASHDLQTPLWAVAGYVQLLKHRYKGRLDAKADQFIDSAAGGVERMQALIRDLLNYSRVGRTEPPAVPVDLGIVMKTSLALIQKTIRETGAVINVEPLPTVQASPMRMGQLFENLIGNALKYRGERHPEIRIRAEKRKTEWVLSVQDNGIGIEPQYFGRIFEVFQRLHSRNEYAGTGIGLAVCKKIVELYGGRIWVESKPGEGSTFKFTLPE